MTNGSTSHAVAAAPDTMPQTPRLRAVMDVRELPTVVFGNRSLLWWGTIGLMVVESAVFVLSIASYFYLRERVTPWPPNVNEPGIFWGTINTLVLLISIWPNQYTKNAAERFDERAVRWGLLVCIVFAAAFLWIRVYEFRSLLVRWDVNAYGSATWTLLGLHTTHLVTDFLDTVVLALVMWWGPGSQRRYMDVSENAVYWYFVVITWIPIYATIYIMPRVL